MGQGLRGMELAVQGTRGAQGRLATMALVIGPREAGIIKLISIYVVAEPACHALGDDTGTVERGACWV